jgi:hypothetical protein
MTNLLFLWGDLNFGVVSGLNFGVVSGLNLGLGYELLDRFI